VATTGVLHLLGVGGYRAGFLWTALPLAAGGAALTLLVLRDVEQRLTWAGVVLLVGLTVAARLVDVAPPSAGTLAARMDGLDLPFFKELDERRTGHSWCSPHCPRVVRTYDAPDTAPFAAVHEVVLALAQKQIEVVPRPGAERVRVRHDDVVIEVTARQQSGDVTVVIDYRALD
jgi:hypothetical protein